MPKVLNVPLSTAGLNKAAEWLEDYAKSALPKNCTDLISMMIGEGEHWAINELGHIDTGSTLSTIMGYREGDSGVILANGAAIWIEFGTGVVANAGSTPHPKAAELGMSPWGTYGKGHGASFNGWWYKGDDGEYHHTMGIPANHFMYNTAQMLRRECGRMAQEIFSK